MKSKGRKTVNMMQKTLIHKVLFQCLHHLSFIFGLIPVFFRSSHNICIVIIMETNCDPPTGSVDYNVYPLR